MKIKDYILIGIIVILLLIVLFNKPKVKQLTKEIENTHKIDSLTYLNKEKADSIKELFIEIDSLNSYNDKLKLSLNKNILLIKNIENETRKKNSVLSFYNVDELEKFFTERYDTLNR
jgi:predicted Holliday junction resolvase-like endonuclease